MFGGFRFYSIILVENAAAFYPNLILIGLADKGIKLLVPGYLIFLLRPKNLYSQLKKMFG